METEHAGKPFAARLQTVRRSPVLTTLTAGIAGTALVWVCYRHRLDAPGHFAVGFGLTTFLVTASSFAPWRLGRSVALAVVLSLIAAIAAELWVFPSLLPDAVDVANSVFGTVLAAGCFTGMDHLPRPERLRLFAVSAGFILLGFILRFGPVGAFTWFNR